MLSAGTRVGPYELVSWLGAGGMGEVAVLKAVEQQAEEKSDHVVFVENFFEELGRGAPAGKR